MFSQTCSATTVDLNHYRNILYYSQCGHCHAIFLITVVLQKCNGKGSNRGLVKQWIQLHTILCFLEKYHDMSMLLSLLWSKMPNSESSHYVVVVYIILAERERQEDVVNKEGFWFCTCPSYLVV